MLPEASDLAVNLISLFIIYDSNKRISAKEAIKHEYFFEKPFPATLEEMQRPKEKKLDMGTKEYNVDLLFHQHFEKWIFCFYRDAK